MRRVVVALAIAVSISLLSLGAPGAVANAPKPGQTCPKAGLMWEGDGMKLKCVKKGKRLIWQKVKGGGSDSGGDYGSQPVPADGKWKVPPGYPDDLPPTGWRGEPAWFITNWDVLTAQKVGPACGQYPLTHLITDLASLDSITPQGFMQPGAHAMPVPHM